MTRCYLNFAFLLFRSAKFFNADVRAQIKKIGCEHGDWSVWGLAKSRFYLRTVLGRNADILRAGMLQFLLLSAEFLAARTAGLQQNIGLVRYVFFELVHRQLQVTLFLSISLKTKRFCVSYKKLSESGQNSDPDENAGRKVTSNWTYEIGEEILDMKCISSYYNKDSFIVALGDRNMYCLNDNGSINFMKRLEYPPSCFTTYFTGKFLGNNKKSLH